MNRRHTLSLLLSGSAVACLRSPKPPTLVTQARRFAL
jgi:hypothetical protein